MFWVIICVGGTAIPVTLDLARSFLPRDYQLGRLVASWQKPLLLSMVMLLCASGYYLFWASVLPYSYRPLSIQGVAHGILASILWLNTVWNYVACVVVDPGGYAVASWPEPRPSFACVMGASVMHPSGHFQAPAVRSIEAGTKEGYTWPAGSRYCAICESRVLHFDHHCPFTGGCVGGNNLRFFLLFIVHCLAGMLYACLLSWWPFRDCVLQQCTISLLGMVRIPPPDEKSCQDMAARSLLFLPCAVLVGALSCLGGLHAVLLANGLTTAQCVRRFRGRGWRSIADLLAGRGERETEKWTLLWGDPMPSLRQRARVLLLPSLPASRKLSPGIAQRWHGLLAALTCLSLLLLLALPATAALRDICNLAVGLTNPKA